VIVGVFAVIVCVIYTMWAWVLVGLALGVAYMVVCSTIAWRAKQSEFMWLLIGQFALWGAAWAVRPWVDTVALLVAYIAALIAAILVEVLAPAGWRPPTSSLSSRRFPEGRARGVVAPDRDLSDEIDGRWDAFLAATPMRLLHQAPDPGNPGADVILYEITAGPWVGERVLQVIDASPEDGINRRVGIPVGRDHTDAGAALADTWGLDPEQYQPIRHT
jgi:hypothetical protein